jgi:DNA modification methylase
MQRALSSDNECVIGDCRAVLPTFLAELFHCCVTSPPYWGLRDYGHEQQIGLEPTPEEFVAELVAVFREVRRVLRDDGTLWLNLGDCYATGAGKSTNPGGGVQGARWRGETTRHRDERRRDHGQPARNGRGKPQTGRASERSGHEGKQSYRVGPLSQPNRMPIVGLKPKDMVGMPWRVAFALQADGWYLRKDIIWHKPNPMPESVTDRPTSAHEYLFLLSKSERYHYDAAAIAEPLLHPESATDEDASRAFTRRRKTTPASRQGAVELEQPTPTTRNARSVWTIPSEPYDGAHFACFPTALAQKCILAGSPLGGVVLDPFFGSGTVGQVAEVLGRRWFGIELQSRYEPLIAKRTAQKGLAFGQR